MDSDDLLPDQCQKDIPKDDASIEILSEGGDSRAGDLEWSIYSAGRSIAGSTASLMDFQKLSIHSKMATIFHNDGRQLIERRDSDDGLPYSAEFYLGDEVWKLSGEDCLLMSPRQYIAKVSVEGTVDLDGAVDFDEAVRRLLSKLKVVKVLMDEQLEEHNKAKGVVKMFLGKLADGLWENVDHKQDLMFLRKLFRKHGHSLNINFKLDLKTCSHLSREIMSALDNYVSKALKLIQRNEIFVHFDNSLMSDEFINDALQEALNAYRNQLVAICPATMKDKLNKLDDEHILLVTMDDISLFYELASLGQAIFEPVLEIIFSKFLTRVEQITEDDLLADVGPLSSRIFLYVCKSMQQIAEQLGAHIITDNVIVYSEEHGWAVTDLPKESQTSYSKCLRQQLQILTKLANHFEPGGPFRASRFPYEFKLFQDMDTIPEQVRIWLCILDDSMKDEISADFDKMQMLSCFFKSYVSFVSSENFRSETFECLRMITHDTLRSLTGMESTQHERISMDSALLECNDMIGSCLKNFPRKHFENEIDQIQATLQRIICQTMNKNAPPAFSNAFKNLLTDLSDLQLEWFIRLPPSEERTLLIRGLFIAPVDNRWKDTEHECFRVVDLEGFVKMYELLYEAVKIPKHYQLNVVHAFLQCLEELATKQRWLEENRLSDQDQLDAMTALINSIRRSMLYLKKQSDFTCFEKFLQEMSEPFAQAVEESRSLEDFHNKVIPLMNDCEARTFSSSDVIDNGKTSALMKYTTQYEKYIKETGTLTSEERIKHIVSDVLLRVEPQLATDWTEEFKQNTLPKVLAGLSAVWSIIISETGCSLGKLVRPTCLQISCVLRIFDGQNHYEDDHYRLLYLSTQQGKDLVLGLTAALFALYDHKVQIACYNSNLTMKNSNYLLEMFMHFSIHSNISYGSVDDMARERSRVVYEKLAENIYECLGIENYFSTVQNESEDEKSVLLIDDIDILLLGKTLGMPFERIVAPTIPGLGLIQEKWFSTNEFARSKEKGRFIFNTNETTSAEEVERFICQSNDPRMFKLRAFLDRPQSYIMLEGRLLEEKEYTNRTLFTSHMKILENCEVHGVSHPNDNFRLTSDGVIMARTLKDIYFYNNAARYLKLNDLDFQQTVKGYKNYGYFPLAFLTFPYASLVKSFPLVHGFGSALLDGYEELILHDHYGIYQTIGKSNPFKSTLAKFDPQKDFLCVHSELELDWMVAIMVAINAAIEKNDSVLVFFRSVIEMQQFQSEFGLQLKRLSVTVFETASNGKNLCEDEFAVEEVTVLVIEEMERSGHEPKDRKIHVVQTFFSDDSKEEDLIRRQAERRKSSGSYELIIRRGHVSLPVEHCEDNINYDLLVRLRTKTNRIFSEAKKRLKNNMESYEKLRKFCDKF